MLKFIKHHLEQIAGVEIYPMISLMIFVIFFAVLLVGVLKADKNKIDKVSNYPLED